VVALLNEYLTEMAEAVRPFNGYINNFIGDAIVVVFGAHEALDRLPRADQSQRAQRACGRLRRRSGISEGSPK
jgi:class 3 adenylate cyclase